ncbi:MULTISPECIES: hypothetical protein [unclassified Brevundimonas]|uniref:hypothetical protein n=1 Tax=unclassified Brevundimonas TaxID=2622653 RepID=UPI0025C4D7AA|nr:MULTISPECIES: hypothetical protein [unclassified Brevundimonas]
MTSNANAPWWYSDNGEDFNGPYDTRAEALEAAREDELEFASLVQALPGFSACRYIPPASRLVEDAVDAACDDGFMGEDGPPEYGGEDFVAACSELDALEDTLPRTWRLRMVGTQEDGVPTGLAA